MYQCGMNRTPITERLGEAMRPICRMPVSKLKYQGDSVQVRIRPVDDSDHDHLFGAWGQRERHARHYDYCPLHASAHGLQAWHLSDVQQG